MEDAPIVEEMRHWLPICMLCACSEYEFVEKVDSIAGGEPRIEVDPTILDMGVYELHGPSGTRRVAVSNVGEAPLTVLGATVSDASGPFTVAVMDETRLEPDQSLNLVVEFTPTLTGTARDQLVVSSNDPMRPEVAVELNAVVPEAATDEVPDILLTPTSHDFGVIGIDDTDSAVFEVRNRGTADLVISELELFADSGELSLDRLEAANGALPWTLPPDEAREVTVHYSPTDDAMDGAELVVNSNDPARPEVSAYITGNGRGFSGFSTGWYIYDDGLDHETTSSPAHVIDTHGDTDLYWYEPSGVHGTTDREADFARMREYVITGAGAPTEVTGPISFSSSSHLATFAFATYTYVACDFWIEPDEDPVLYAVGADAVDDGVQFMVNGHILGHMYLHSEPQHWSLHEVGRPGEVNTLIAILVDDSRSHRYLNNLRFTRDGVMVE